LYLRSFFHNKGQKETSADSPSTLPTSLQVPKKLVMVPSWR
jgi:hypothetical protein